MGLVGGDGDAARAKNSAAHGGRRNQLNVRVHRMRGHVDGGRRRNARRGAGQDRRRPRRRRHWMSIGSGDGQQGLRLVVLMVMVRSVTERRRRAHGEIRVLRRRLPRRGTRYGIHYGAGILTTFLVLIIFLLFVVIFVVIIVVIIVIIIVIFLFQFGNFGKDGR